VKVNVHETYSICSSHSLAEISISRGEREWVLSVIEERSR